MLTEDTAWPLHSSIHASSTPLLPYWRLHQHQETADYIQNSIARMVLRTTHTRPADLLSELHWLPVQSRISFKIACLTYKIVSIGQPIYTWETCSIIIHLIVLYAQSTNTSLFPLNLTNDPSVTLHLKHGTVYHRNKTFPTLETFKRYYHPQLATPAPQLRLLMLTFRAL